MASRGVLVTGTDTEVGKTVVSCALIRQIRQTGVSVVGMKPVASGMVQRGGQWVNEDVIAIKEAMDRQVEESLFNPYCYRPFIAPHLAAGQVGEEISLDHIVNCYRQLAEDADWVVVEGAGGVMTPLNDRETFLDLADSLSLPVILVVAIRLGCINHALLTVQALQARDVPFAGWVANYPTAVDQPDLAVETALVERIPGPLLGTIPHSSQGHKFGGIDLNQMLSNLL